MLAPGEAVAGRNAAVAWRLRGVPGDTAIVRLRDEAGTLDSTRIAVGPDSIATGAFRVRPTRPGWRTWTVVADTVRRAAGTWVLPARPLRALVADAPGSIEAREVARALERGGAQVTLAADLGRGLRLGNAPAGLPADVSALGDFDVVVVLSGAAVDGRTAPLDAYLAAGGGVALAGAASALRAATLTPAQRDARTLDLTVPAPIAALPAADLRATVHPLEADTTAVLRLGFAGRGRWAALAIEDTWRWALEAGRTDALAAFWRSLADWLAAGLSGPFHLAVTQRTAAPGIPIDIRVAAFDGARIDRLVLGRPGGPDTLAIAWTGDAGRARFVAAREGDHEIRFPDGSVAGGHRADVTAPPPDDGVARLGALVVASGGRFLPADSLDALPSAPADRRLAVVALIVLLAFVEWTMRRLRGMA